MNELSIFKDISPNEMNDILKSLGSRKISFKKEHIIFSNLVEDDLIGVVLSGKVNIINYDYFGNRDIIDSLEYDAIFGKPFSYMNNNISIISATDCEILFLDYHKLMNNQSKYEKINYNINNLLTSKIYQLYEKLEILSKRTIREKLLNYFGSIARKRGKKTFNLPITYIELADYLSVDRSAMMREIKKLKDEKIITVIERKITIN